MFHKSVLFPPKTQAKSRGIKMTPRFLDTGYLDVSTVPPSSLLSRRATSPCFVTILNLGSLLGLVPFKIKLDQDTNSYRIRPLHLIRKVLCAAIHLQVIWSYIGFNQKLEIITKPTELSSNFIQTFDFVNALGSLALMVLFVVSFWRCQEQLLKIVEETRVELTVGAERKLIAAVIIIFLNIEK